MWGIMVFKLLLLFTIIIQHTECQQNILNYWVEEGPPWMQFSIDVSSDSGLASKISSDAFQKAQFKISESSVINTLFVIDANTGIITPTGQIDREVICPQAKFCTILMDISILSPPDYFDIIKLTILVNDTNDNTPTFDTGLFEIPIPENAAIGSTFTVAKAIDLDSPENGVKGYRLLDSVIEISLKTVTNVDGTIEPLIELQTNLDREEKSSFEFRIEAFDSVELSNSNNAILSVKVNVVDVNDNPPVFNKALYNTTVLENAPLQKSLIQVKAIDPDFGDNGKLIYSFDSQTESLYSSFININNDTGDIFLIQNLDYETTSSLQLTILAKEKNPTHMPAKCLVHINIQDVNDNQPGIIVNPISGTQDRIEIKENVKIGAFLAHISVSDKDTGNSGEVYCAIYTPNDPGVFALKQLSPNDYKLLTNSSIDREKKAEYNVVFVCRDGGIPSLTADHESKVIILDENDHAPVFVQDKFTFQIYENNPVGHELLYLNVTDLDSGRNAEVVFQVLSGPQHYITLDPYTGNITARVSFDYEQAQDVAYEIIAYDQGDISRTATATINIEVLDVNDEPPKFTMPEYIFHVLENLEIGADVGHVSAYDPDSKSNGEFQFELVAGSPNSNLFVIERSSGAIFTRVTFDREEKEQYIIKVKVFDIFLPSLFSVMDITVNVDDENDHKPEIRFPNEDNDTYVIDSNPTDFSEALIRIIASDADKGINSALQYLIISGNDKNAFSIDHKSGYIYVQDLQELYRNSKYQLNIVVKDSGSPSLNSQTILNVLVDAEPQVLAVNTVIIITVGVLSGVIVSSLAIAILLIKMRVPKKRKYHENSVNGGPGLPDHYTVQPVEEFRVADNVSELSVSVLSSCQQVQQDSFRMSPSSMQIGLSPQITSYDHTIFTESRDKFSDGSNSDSGLGSHEEGIAVISTPVISMDMRYNNHEHIPPASIHQSPLQRQQYNSSNLPQQPAAKRHLSFTNGRTPPPYHHITKHKPQTGDSITKKTTPKQDPYSEDKYKDIMLESPQKQYNHQRINSYNSSHKAHQGYNSEHLPKEGRYNESRQSPMVWEYSPKGDSKQSGKFKHLSYAESAHQNNDVAGHEIALFNRDNVSLSTHHVSSDEKIGEKSCKHTGDIIAKNVDTDVKFDGEDCMKNKCTEPKTAVSIVGAVITANSNAKDNENTELKNPDTALLTNNNDDSNNSSCCIIQKQQQQPSCLSNDNLNRYPKDEAIIDPTSPLNSINNIQSSSVSDSQNDKSSLVKDKNNYDKNDENLSRSSSSNKNQVEDKTNSKQDFAGVKFVDFDNDHEENIV